MRQEMPVRNMFLILNMDNPDEDLSENPGVSLFVEALCRQVIQ